MVAAWTSVSGNKALSLSIYRILLSSFLAIVLMRRKYA